MMSVEELCEATSLKPFTVKQTLKRTGWHVAKGGSDGHSPWHQDDANHVPMRPRKLRRALILNRRSSLNGRRKLNQNNKNDPPIEIGPLLRGGTTSIVAQWVHFIDDHDRPRSAPRSLISKITKHLWSRIKRTSIDLDRYLDRSACIDRKSHFDRYLDTLETRFYRHLMSL